MVIIEHADDLKTAIKLQRNAGKTIGFVPTMGYLHEGHISLVKASIRDNGFTVMSIFVNPTQFGVNEDFARYPRNLARDSEIAETAGVDVIFAPSSGEMYPDGYKTFVEVMDITEVLCGKSRKGHFKGVATIVAKLFNIVEPDRAYFGQKDAQQAAVIRKMAADLNMNVKIVVCPIIREADGLAMSSRNVYLTPEERRSAQVLSRSLFEASAMIKNGERCKEKILKHIRDMIDTEKHSGIEYVEILKADLLQDTERIEGTMLVALAVKFGETRLIDNVIVEV